MPKPIQSSRMCCEWMSTVPEFGPECFPIVWKGCCCIAEHAEELPNSYRYNAKILSMYINDAELRKLNQPYGCRRFFDPEVARRFPQVYRKDTEGFQNLTKTCRTIPIRRSLLAGTIRGPSGWQPLGVILLVTVFGRWFMCLLNSTFFSSQNIPLHKQCLSLPRLQIYTIFWVCKKFYKFVSISLLLIIPISRSLFYGVLGYSCLYLCANTFFGETQHGFTLTWCILMYSYTLWSLSFTCVSFSPSLVDELLFTVEQDIYVIILRRLSYKPLTFYSITLFFKCPMKQDKTKTTYEQLTDCFGYYAVCFSNCSQAVLVLGR